MTKPAYGSSVHYLGREGEDYFHRYGRLGAINGEINAHKFRHLVQQTDTVLDFGCGGGDLLRALDCSRRIGVEINPAARRHCAESGIECYEDLTAIADNVADIVISNHVLEHVPYPIEALRQLRSKLKPGGTLTICVPIDDWRSQKRYGPEDRNHHLHTWTVPLLGHSLSEAGFSVEDITMVTHAWPRGYQHLYRRLPLFWFNLACTAWAALTRRRQLLAVARPARKRPGISSRSSTTWAESGKTASLQEVTDGED